MRHRALDLFCGAGGLSLGLRDAGFQIQSAVDNWPIALETYRQNFPEHPALQADIASMAEQIRLWRSEEIDLIAGGPPCQGFSIQRIGDDRDHRNELVLSFATTVAEVQPRMFLMENVPGLLGARGRETFNRFSAAMQKAGYGLRSKIVDAAAYGVPQSRKRVLVVGWRRNLLPEYHFPAPLLAEGEFKTVKEAIGDISPPPADFTGAPGDPLHRRMRLSPKNLARLALIPAGGGFEDLPIDMRVNCHRNGADRIGHRSVYGRLDPDRPAGTITARFDSFTRGRFAHPWEDRNISLREGARLQSFPDWFKFTGTQEEITAQIGNAIPPLLAQYVGRSLIEHLQGAHRAPAVQGSLPLFGSRERASA
jgi:DNA (cytosine-5)-methyltransferase 1